MEKESLAILVVSPLLRMKSSQIQICDIIQFRVYVISIAIILDLHSEQVDQFVDGRHTQTETLVFVLGMNAIHQIVNNATLVALEERTATTEVVIVAEVSVLKRNEVELRDSLHIVVSVWPFELNSFDAVRGECVVQC